MAGLCETPTPCRSGRGGAAGCTGQCGPVRGGARHRRQRPREGRSTDSPFRKRVLPRGGQRQSRGARGAEHRHGGAGWRSSRMAGEEAGRQDGARLRSGFHARAREGGHTAGSLAFLSWGSPGITAGAGHTPGEALSGPPSRRRGFATVPAAFAGRGRGARGPGQRSQPGLPVGRARRAAAGPVGCLAPLAAQRGRSAGSGRRLRLPRRNDTARTSLDAAVRNGVVLQARHGAAPAGAPIHGRQRAVPPARHPGLVTPPVSRER